MATKGKANTVADFMASNDRETILRNRIKAQLAVMLRTNGAECHETEKDFCVAAGVNTNDIGDFRTEFRKYIAYVPKLLGKKAHFVWFADSNKVPSKFRYTPESSSG